MRKSLRSCGLAGMLLVSTALLVPGHISWGADDFYVIATSQWKRNGSNVYFTDGNVGIGTTSPGSPLTVQSNSTSAISAASSAAGATVISATLATPGAGTAVSGYSASTDPSAIGVYGSTYGGTAVYGLNNATTGAGAGVKGYIAAAGGFGVSGENSALGGTAIYAVNSANDGIGTGVYAATNSVSEFARGVYASAPNGVGVYGTTSGGTGVWGVSANGTGVYGLSDVGYGVHGYSSSGYGVYCDGDSWCTGNATIVGNFSVLIGTKSAVVPTSQGNRKLYSQESPELWFEDFGEGRLAGGKAEIKLDPLFLETVSIDEAHPMKVFIQLNNDCKGVYVRRQKTSFKVIELNGGTSRAQFSYRVVAKRKGFENARLEAAGDTPKLAALKVPQK
jgi:hypothetical protein